MTQVSETEREDLEESEKTQHWVEKLCQTRLEQISSVENDSPETPGVRPPISPSGTSMRKFAGGLQLPTTDLDDINLDDVGKSTKRPAPPPPPPLPRTVPTLGTLHTLPGHLEERMGNHSYQPGGPAEPQSHWEVKNYKERSFSPVSSQTSEQTYLSSPKDEQLLAQGNATALHANVLLRCIT
ncbi:UNVERIFIED_CONTAM: hypothetical protein K2H54_059903 [Gekko kuhli]